jgi:hypothetical protein
MFLTFSSSARVQARMASRSGAAALLAACALSTATAAQIAKFKGVNVVGEGFEAPFPFGSPQMFASFDIAAASGVEWVHLSFVWYVSSTNSTEQPYEVSRSPSCPTGAPFRNASSPSVEAIVSTIQAAHTRGLRVSLRPMIDPDWNLPANDPDATYRGNIGVHFNSQEWADFFQNYTSWLLTWVAVANENSVEAFCVGAELTATESQPALWRQTIASIRAAYTVAAGIVYYSATSPSKTFPWDASDVIGIDVYPNLGIAGDPTQATVADLVQGWAGPLAGFASFSAANGGKPVLFAESGICSVNKTGIYLNPSFFECYSYPIDLGVQAKYYESLFQAAWPQPWMAGVFFWKWAWQGGPQDPTFFPLNKTAQAVMAQYFGNGTAGGVGV